MTLKEIKNKIILTRNISEMTKALELVSAVKMKKAQTLAMNSRPFTEKTLGILKNISKHQREIEEQSFFFKNGSAGKILAVVITSDKGFCGAFNRNILNSFEKEIKKEKNIEIFAIGKKAINFLKKKNHKILVEFSGIGDYGKLDETKPISKLIVKYFREKKFRKILLFYTDFVSTFLQKPIKIQVLPLDLGNLKKVLKDYELKEKKTTVELAKIEEGDYILEPSPKEIFESLVPQLIEYLIYHSVLEANASEHSARMMAMRSASDNAKELMGELKLEYNKARQFQITAEVLEVSMAKEALE